MKKGDLLLDSRPLTIKGLFPNSKALIVSGKAINEAMRRKGAAVALAANGRNFFVIKGVLRAAQRAKSAVIIEIAKSEGGKDAYCAVNFWNIARIVDALCNQMDITIPVAIHADHYGIKSGKDIITAKEEIPSMFDAGITSIAIDASHLSDAENLLANINLHEYLPWWAGYETEVGEIKGKEGLSTVAEALFLIQGLNAHGIFPDWIALNNGTTHGIEESDSGIQVELTAKIHAALAKYHVSGAQHGTSGNNYERLRRIVRKTATTKANVATALQMIAWGLEVNEYGNAKLDINGNFIKHLDQGVTGALWMEMVDYAEKKNWKKGDFKKLHLPFDNKLLAQPKNVRERMVRGVEEFAFEMITQVFDSTNTAELVEEVLLNGGVMGICDIKKRIERSEDWTPELILERAQTLNKDKGPEGDFED